MMPRHIAGSATWQWRRRAQGRGRQCSSRAAGGTWRSVVPDALNIVLYPLAPTDGGTFQSKFLTGLTISAYEVDVPTPIPAAGAQPAGNLIGTAKYDKTVTSTSTSAIVQHWTQTTALIPASVAAAVASAVIFLPANIDAGKPYVNVVLKIARSGVGIADRSFNYDAPVASLGTPLNFDGNFDTYQGSGTKVPCFTVPMAPSLYVGLLPPAGALPSVNLPADGGPPPFSDLQTAVQKVLAVDPTLIDPAAGVPNIASLTPQQCTHIARELLWVRTAANPVPGPDTTTQSKVPLEQLYTAAQPPPAAPASLAGDDKDRQEFDGALHGYYGQLDASTARMAQYIYAMSTAIQCSQRAGAADTAELYFPVRRNTTAGAGQIATAAIRLKG